MVTRTRTLTGSILLALALTKFRGEKRKEDVHGRRSSDGGLPCPQRVRPDKVALLCHVGGDMSQKCE